MNRDEFVTATGETTSLSRGPHMGFRQWLAMRRHHYNRIQDGLSRLDKYGVMGAQVNGDIAFYGNAEDAYFEYLNCMDFRPTSVDQEDESPTPPHEVRAFWAWLIRYLSGIKAAVLAV